ncbi:Degenerin [Aphelenchoides besseyi]|nr:Degenerin [Aphelenchoides besseyi]
MTLREIANLWGLSEYQNQPSFISHVRQALIEIAASLTPEERQELCYSLPELVSSCNIGKSPCDMDNDFSRVFDVDYGYCYTFNSNKIRDVYRSSQTGALHGLRMVLFTNPITYLNSTESKGFKVVLHDQDYNPFPNTEGYFGAVGESIRFIVEEDRYSRLNHPYNECDNLNSLKHRNQPFYYDGDYSIEGCLRSCFQQKMVNACKCADPRFPYPNDDSFCSQTNLTNCKNTTAVNITLKPKEITISLIVIVQIRVIKPSSLLNCGRLHGQMVLSFTNNIVHRQNCRVSIAKNITGKMNHLSFEQNNSAEILVYYNRLRYSEYIERPQSTFVDLLSALGGATALWIGCCAIFIGELLLLFIQSILWCFCCKKELPEVPSCRHFDYDNDARNDRWLKEGTPLHFENHMNETTFNDDILFSEYHVMYKQIIPLHHVDHIPPAPVSSVPLSRVYID